MADCDFIYQVHPFVRHQIWSGYASLLTMPKLETDINNRPKKNRVSIHIISSITLGLRIKKLIFFFIFLPILSKSNLKNSNFRGKWICQKKCYDHPEDKGKDRFAWILIIPALRPHLWNKATESVVLPNSLNLNSRQRLHGWWEGFIGYKKLQNKF